MKLLEPLVFGGVLMLMGCSHGTMRGTVAMKISDREAHVCMGDKEVGPGDKVALFKNECVSPKEAVRLSGPSSGGCRRVKLGEGQVIQVLNEHYSVIEVNPGVAFEEGTVVEKE